MEKEKLMRAVHDLRKSEGLDLTQTQFAARLGISMQTIQRWEKLVPPRGRPLLDLKTLALEVNRPDLASIFNSAFMREFGTPGYMNIGQLASIRIPLIRDELLLLRNDLKQGKAAPGQKIRKAIDALERILLGLDELNNAAQWEGAGSEQARQNEQEATK